MKNGFARNHEAEERFIAAVVKDDTDERRRECIAIPPDAFKSLHCRIAWEHVVAAKDYIEAATGPARVFFANKTHGAEYLDDRWKVLVSLLDKRGEQFIPELSRLVGTTKNKLFERLNSRRFNLLTPPPEPQPRWFIAGKPAFTAGNLSNIIAQAKAGKTAFLSAMIAARICAQIGGDRDTLGVTASVHPGRLIQLDTEQSPYDADQNVRRSLRRAGVDEAPDWLDSYSLAGFSADELRRALRALLERTQPGSVFAVTLDGTADFVDDVNDPKECNAFVAELHDLAIKHACPIVNVMHENPGQDGGKMRGHLGSQLERKAESNIRLRKTDEITGVYADKMRKAPILEKDGPRFRWSNQDGMHVSIASAQTDKDDAKREKLRDLAEAMYAEFGKETMKYSEILATISKIKRITASTAEDNFRAMKGLGVITKNPISHEWSIIPVTP